MMKKKALPPLNRRKKEKIDKNDEDDLKIGEDNLSRQKNEENFVNNQMQNNPENNSRPIPFEVPEFLKKADNEQFLQMFIRMRQRHFADGAVFINVESDDIADQNLELYDNKGINIDPPVINEKNATNIEYYIESSNRDKFYKISKGAIMEMEKEKNKLIDSKKHKKSPQYKDKYDKEENKNKEITAMDIKRATEDQIFALFDDNLTEIINKTANKVTLLFLFAQGLLAGI